MSVISRACPEPLSASSIDLSHSFVGRGRHPLGRLVRNGQASDLMRPRALLGLQPSSLGQWAESDGAPSRRLGHAGMLEEFHLQAGSMKAALESHCLPQLGGSVCFLNVFSTLIPKIPIDNLRYFRGVLTTYIIPLGVSVIKGYG